jgi:Pyridoxamine 5'-phosphate oxidase
MAVAYANRMTDITTWLSEVQDATFARVGEATRGSFAPEQRLSGETLVKVLTTRRNAVVSTTRRDGRPHSTPSSFVLFDHAIWLPVVAGAVRLRHVARQPWMSMVIAEGQLNTHGVVIIEGPAEIVTDVPAELIQAATRKLSSVTWIENWIKLTPQRLLSYASPGWNEDGV